MMTLWRRLAAAAVLTVLAVLGGVTQAQTRIERAQPAALDCLQVPAGAPSEPVYPFDQYKGGAKGRVQAAVTIPGGLFSNDIEILFQEGDAAFVDSSRQFLHSLSAPCLKPGETVRLLYDFVFRPDERKVVWGLPRTADDPARDAMLKCLVHSEGEKSRHYPDAALRSLAQGRLFAWITFSAPDTAPEVELLHRPSAAVFARSVRAWIAKARMPCHQGEPYRMGAVFVFRLGDDSTFGFKPLQLTELLSASKGIRDRRLEIDTTTMGCPFSLRLGYYQPLRRNSVGEVGDSDPQRRPLLELLSGLELDLPPGVLDAVFADTADVAVPCMRLNLNDPKEKN